MPWTCARATAIAAAVVLQRRPATTVPRGSAKGVATQHNGGCRQILREMSSHLDELTCSSSTMPQPPCRSGGAMAFRCGANHPICSVMHDCGRGTSIWSLYIIRNIGRQRPIEKLGTPSLLLCVGTSSPLNAAAKMHSSHAKSSSSEMSFRLARYSRAPCCRCEALAQA